MAVAAAAAPLEVHEVGDYVASFVPTMDDFDRLDPRFRISRQVWSKIPAYEDYGFAVFQLKTREGELHPMAFEFETRIPDRTFFPTVHIHDGQVHSRERFDHTLYLQDARLDRLVGEYQNHDVLDPATHLVRSDRIASAFAQPHRAEGIVEPNLLVHRIQIHGEHANEDVVYGLDQASIAPSPLTGWALRIGPAAIGAGALAWVISRRRRLSRQRAGK